MSDNPNPQSIEDRISQIVQEHNMSEAEAREFVQTFANKLNENLGGALTPIVSKRQEALYKQYKQEVEPFRGDVFKVVQLKQKYRKLGLNIW